MGVRWGKYPSELHTPKIFKLPFVIPFWLVFFFVFVRESRVIRQAFPEASSVRDAGTFRMLLIGSPLAMLAGVAASFLPWLTMSFPVAAVVTGTTMLLVGGVLRRYCFNTLGRFFTGAVVVSTDQEIIQHGVYRLVRHPSYMAAFLMFTGMGIALGNWISVAILFLARCFFYGIQSLG